MPDPTPPVVELVVSLGAIDLPFAGSFVYLLWDADDALLYVGESSNVLGRLGGHVTAIPGLRRISVVPCRDEIERRALESWLIAHYQPPLNIAGTDRDVRPLRLVGSARRTQAGDRKIDQQADEAIRATLADHGRITPPDLREIMAGRRSRGWAYDYLAKLASRGLLARAAGDAVAYVGAGDWAA